MKVANKKIPTEPKFIRMANGSSEPAAAPRTVKARVRVNRLLRTKYQASFAANASNCIDIWLACELTDDDKDRIARIHRIGRYRIDSPIKATC
jgi:hypothetical protein